MHATIRRYNVKPTAADEVTRKVQQNLVPIVSKIRGFISYHVIDTGQGVVASFSLYENEAGTNEANRAAADWVRANLAEHITGEVQTTAGRVTVSAGETAKRAGA